MNATIDANIANVSASEPCHKVSLVRTAGSWIPSAICKIFYIASKSILSLINYIFGRNGSAGNGWNLIKTTREIDSSEHSFSINLSLLNEIKSKAGNDAERETIRFLSANYLAKTAPDLIKVTRYLHPDVEHRCQVGQPSDHIYHRTMSHQMLSFESRINQNLGLQNKSPLILTDTTEISQLFPLKYTNLKRNADPAEMASAMMQTIDVDPDTADITLKKPFLFDLTDCFGEMIKTEGDKTKEKQFSRSLDDFKKELESAIEILLDKLIEKQPSFAIHRKRLRDFIKKTVTCICRVQIEGNVSGIKILPLFADLHGKRLLKVHPEFIEFVDSTGIIMGAVNMRRYLHKASKTQSDVRWGIPSNSKDNTGVVGELAKYYPTKHQFTQSAFFERLSSLFKTHKKPHIQVLGKATMDLLNGLMESISEPAWSKLIENPVYGQIALFAFFKIREHLATAELHIDDFARFAQEIELVHCEITALLEVTSPFTRADFSDIYTKLLRPLVPEGLKLTAGLGKTAMNTFAGINAAIMKQNPNPHRVYGSGVYYEEVGLVGYSQSFEQIKGNQNTPKVDLYVGQFSPNVTPDPSLTTYKPGDVAGDIRYLLDHDKAADHLTIAIDCTIDKFYSVNVENILSKFESEIKNGKLNFIFFHSGQKMDMLGMDNYYGSPFYTVNDGGSQWTVFESLQTDQIHQTDALSLQWFCLSHKYASDSLSRYRELIFKNARYILDRIPEALQPTGKPSQKMKINAADPAMDATFIDIKMLGSLHKIRSYIMCGLLCTLFFNQKIKLQARGSFGFYHANITTISAEMSNSSTVRLNPGINSEENDAILSCLEQIQPSQSLDQ